MLRLWNDSFGDERVHFGRKLVDGQIVWLCMTPYTNGKTKVVALAGKRVANCVLTCTKTNTSIKMGDTVYSWTHVVRNIGKDIRMYRIISTEVTTIEKTDFGTIKTKRGKVFRNGIEVSLKNSDKEKTVEFQPCTTGKNAEKYKIEVCRSVTTEHTEDGIVKSNRKSLFKNGKEISVIESKESSSVRRKHTESIELRAERSSQGEAMTAQINERAEWPKQKAATHNSSAVSLSSWNHSGFFTPGLIHEIGHQIASAEIWMPSNSFVYKNKNENKIIYK